MERRNAVLYKIYDRCILPRKSKYYTHCPTKIREPWLFFTTYSLCVVWSSTFRHTQSYCSYNHPRILEYIHNMSKFIRSFSYLLMVQSHALHYLYSANMTHSIQYCTPSSMVHSIRMGFFPDYIGQCVVSTDPVRDLTRNQIILQLLLDLSVFSELLFQLMQKYDFNVYTVNLNICMCICMNIGTGDQERGLCTHILQMYTYTNVTQR